MPEAANTLPLSASPEPHPEGTRFGSESGWGRAAVHSHWLPVPPSLRAAGVNGRLRVSQEASPEGRPQWEVADIFRLYGETYRASHTLSEHQAKVMYAIEHCRTGEFGYHIDRCDACGYEELSYNSCRDRHCPKCQGVRQRLWIQARLRDLLSVCYWHVVFTLPDQQLHLLYLYNPELVYNLLFDAAAQTLLTFGRDPHWLGAEMGFFGVLHTWGQTLWLHPHVHFVVPGGGITETGEWIAGKYGKTFLFPVEALSMRFRKLFTEGLDRACEAGELRFPESLNQLELPKAFKAWLKALGKKEFVVFCKPPFGGPEDVVRYVGLYTHRVAISNHRIVSIEGGQIRFSYKDYKGRDERGPYEWKEMSLSADEFIKRFLWHVLPSGFHKIRYFGFLRNGRKNKMLEQIRQALPEEGADSTQPGKTLLEWTGVTCPVCEKGKMIPVAVFLPCGVVVLSFSEFLRRKGRWDTS